jgi:hypothetical protein
MIKRYHPEIVGEYGLNSVNMAEEPDGDWVRYEDAMTAVAGNEASPPSSPICSCGKQMVMKFGGKLSSRIYYECPRCLKRTAYSQAPKDEWVKNEETLRQAAKKLGADNARLRSVLSVAWVRLRNARGAVESNQVVDKDVLGTLSRAITEIDAALSTTSQA